MNCIEAAVALCYLLLKFEPKVFLFLLIFFIFIEFLNIIDVLHLRMNCVLPFYHFLKSIFSVKLSDVQRLIKFCLLIYDNCFPFTLERSLLAFSIFLSYFFYFPGENDGIRFRI